MTNTEWMRKRLLVKVPNDNKSIFTNIASLKKTQWSETFLKLMQNRMLFGAFRYGKLIDQLQKTGPRYNNLSSIKKRIALYDATGNLEHLVDIGNLCMIEFETKEHDKAHFEASDDGEHATVL